MYRRKPFTHTKNKKTPALFLLFFLLPSPLTATKSIAELINALRKEDCAHRSDYQYELMTALHKNQRVVDCAGALQVLLLDNTIPFLSQHATTLFKALDLFGEVPGFQQTFCTLLSHAHNPATANGFLFEIETALAAHEQGEEIVSFGKRHHSSATGKDREIDLETKKQWIECKNICWEQSRKKKNQEKLERQLKDEQELMSERNKRNARQKVFVLCSKQPIPPEWQQWLQQQRIEYRSTTGNKNERYELSPNSSVSSSAPFPLSSSSSLSHDSESCPISSSSSVSENDSQG